MPSLAHNKKAFFDYEILETVEAGIVLSGPEVKAVREGHLSLKGSFAKIINNELFLINAYITPYAFARKELQTHPDRSRKLLVKAVQIDRLKGKLEVKGLTLLPLKVYTSKNRIKVELGIGKGRHQFEKREVIKKRDVERELRTVMKNNGRHS